MAEAVPKAVYKQVSLKEPYMPRKYDSKGNELFKVVQKSAISYTIRIKKDVYYAPHDCFPYNEEKKTLTYIMGDVVTSFDKIPERMISFEIPAIKYAVFPIRPKNGFAWERAISKMKKYIYIEWLPKSDYEQAGLIGDFEYHDERSTRKKNPEIDLYAAIKEKMG